MRGCMRSVFVDVDCLLRFGQAFRLSLGQSHRPNATHERIVLLDKTFPLHNRHMQEDPCTFLKVNDLLLRTLDLLSIGLDQLPLVLDMLASVPLVLVILLESLLDD